MIDERGSWGTAVDPPVQVTVPVYGTSDGQATVNALRADVAELRGQLAAAERERDEVSKQRIIKHAELCGARECLKLVRGDVDRWRNRARAMLASVRRERKRCRSDVAFLTDGCEICEYKLKYDTNERALAEARAALAEYREALQCVVDVKRLGWRPEVERKWLAGFYLDDPWGVFVRVVEDMLAAGQPAQEAGQ